MSDGLRMLAATLDASSPRTLLDSDASLFVSGPETQVFDFLRQHYRRYRELPTAQTVQAETGVRLPSAPESLGFYVDRVYERSEYNQIRDRFAGLRDGMESRDMAAVSAAVNAMHAVSRSRNRRGNESMNLAQAIGLVEDRLDRTVGYGGITGVETGWPGYDEITGGYQSSDLISVVGRMGTGKTYIALKQAEAAHAAGHNVLFVTTEMGIEQIARRHVSISMGINPRLLKMNTISTYVRNRISAFYRDMAGSERFNIFSVGMNASVQAIEAFVEETGPTIVFIDGIYLLRPSGGSRSMNRTERITMVYDEVRALNLEAMVPFVAVTQFNRQAGKAGVEGSLENIGYTDAVGTHSSIVVGLKLGTTANPMESRILEFLKGREGESGRVAINFKFAPLDMNEIPYVPAVEAGQTQAPAERAAAVDWMAR